jgi:hypothetical protein
MENAFGSEFEPGGKGELAVSSRRERDAAEAGGIDTRVRSGPIGMVQYINRIQADDYFSAFAHSHAFNKIRIHVDRTGP